MIGSLKKTFYKLVLSLSFVGLGTSALAQDAAPSEALSPSVDLTLLKDALQKSRISVLATFATSNDKFTVREEASGPAPAGFKQYVLTPVVGSELASYGQLRIEMWTAADMISLVTIRNIDRSKIGMANCEKKDLAQLVGVEDERVMDRKGKSFGRMLNASSQLGNSIVNVAAMCFPGSTQTTISFFEGASKLKVPMKDGLCGNRDTCGFLEAPVIASKKFYANLYSKYRRLTKAFASQAIQDYLEKSYVNDYTKFVDKFAASLPADSKGELTIVLKSYERVLKTPRGRKAIADSILQR